MKVEDTKKSSETTKDTKDTKETKETKETKDPDTLTFEGKITLQIKMNRIPLIIPFKKHRHQRKCKVSRTRHPDERNALPNPSNANDLLATKATQ